MQIEQPWLLSGGGFVGGELGELPAALDPTELAAAALHPRSGPAQRHLSVPPPFHNRGVFSDDLDHRLHRVDGEHCLDQRPVDAEPGHSKGS